MPEHNRVPAVTAPHASSAGVVFDVGKQHPFWLEAVTELSIQELHGDIVTRPDFGRLLEELMSAFLRPFMDHVLRAVPCTRCHNHISRRTGLGAKESHRAAPRASVVTWSRPRTQYRGGPVRANCAPPETWAHRSRPRGEVTGA